MKQLTGVIITLLVACLLAFGTTPTPIRVPKNLIEIAIPWSTVQTSPEVAYGDDIYLTYLAFSTAGTGRTVTAVDAQGTPVTWITAVSLSANQLTIVAVPEAGRAYLKGGFSLSASGAGVVYQFSGKIRP